MNDLSKVAFKTDPGPYTPFKLMPGDRKGIETPQFAWNKMWSDNVMHFIMDGPYISTDETIYWIDQSFHIHQLNREGDGKWEKSLREPI